MNESVMLDLIITPLHEGVVTGIRDLTVAEDAVIAYPNPVNDRVHIHLAKLRAGAEVKVCDAQGKLLMTQRLIRQKPEIDLSGLRPGLLHIRVRNGKKLTTLSLIKLLKKDIDRLIISDSNMNMIYRFVFRVGLSVMVSFIPMILMAQGSAGATEGVIATDAGIGWAASSVNTVPFRRDPLVTGKGWQFIAYYDTLGHVVLGRRRNGKGAFELRRTAFKGKARDAHNVISIALDGKGHLHMAWDHHSGVLHYARSRSPLSLDLEVINSMVGSLESKVTYPEFYGMPGGDLLFLYRNGASGNGTLVLDRYDVATGKWRRMHDNLIDGEGKRNAYWQMAVDPKGTIHLSWVWRETPDVASNHDLCYARSMDGGTGWQRSDGSAYKMPIDAASAEYAMRIPQGSDLINQTSMCADARGMPYIATYWRDASDSVPHYRIVYRDANGWRSVTPFLRTTPFTLSGGGSRRIPISRPQVLASTKGNKTRLLMIYRDATTGSLPAVAMTPDIHRGGWARSNLSDKPVGSWEPSYDAARWQRSGILSLFVQRTEQINGETGSGMPGQMVQVLDWKPQWKKIPNHK